MVAFLLLLLLLIPSVSAGSTPQEEYSRIQEKMNEQKKMLTEALRRESSILNEVQGMNVSMAKISALLRKYRNALASTEAEIRQVTAEMEKIKARVDKQKDWIKRKLRMLNKFGSSREALVVLLGAEDVSQVMRTWKYLQRIALYEHKVLGDYRQNLRELDERNAKLAALRSELQENSKKVEEKEAELSDKRKSKEIILASVRSEKALHEKMLRELNEASRKLLDMIRESARTDSFGATGFSRLKGKLPWPVSGSLAIAYGSQKDPQFDMPVFRNGIHIRTEGDAETKSVHSGKVIFAEWFKGFGQLVIINHGGGYHSLYGNLSEIFSHAGDIIKENQVIGRVGNSGVLNAPGLYFEIRYKGKPLDPLQWLRHKKG